MNQRLMINIEKQFNEFVMQLNLPVGAPWGDAFAALDEIINMVKELSLKDQERQKEQESPVLQEPIEVDIKVEEAVNAE